MQYATQAQAQQQMQIVQTQNTHVMHKKHYSVAQRAARNAKYALQFTAAQQRIAQTLAQQLQTLFAQQKVYINFNAKSISVQVSNATAIQSLQYYANKCNAFKIVQTNNNVHVHLFAQ